MDAGHKRTLCWQTKGGAAGRDYEGGGGKDGGQGENRTPDTRIFNPLLYRLSYLAGKGRYLNLAAPISQDGRV